jgi:hypothetical protein
MFHLKIITDFFRKEKLSSKKARQNFIILEIVLSKLLANANNADDIGAGI